MALNLTLLLIAFRVTARQPGSERVKNIFIIPPSLEDLFPFLPLCSYASGLLWLKTVLPGLCSAQQLFNVALVLLLVSMCCDTAKAKRTQHKDVHLFSGLVSDNYALSVSVSLCLSVSVLVCGKPLGLCVLKGLKEDATYGILMATFRKQTPSRATAFRRYEFNPLLAITT